MTTDNKESILRKSDTLLEKHGLYVGTKKTSNFCVKSHQRCSVNKAVAKNVAIFAGTPL